MNIKTVSNKDLMLTIFLYTQIGGEEKLDQSLFLLSAQKYNLIEIIIVVDGLIEGVDDHQLKLVLKRWCKSFLRIVLVPPLRSSDEFWTIEKLLPYCQGHYFSFLTAGQRIYPHLYQSLIDGLQTRPNSAWAYCDVMMVHHNQYNQVKLRWTPFLKESYSVADHLLLHHIPLQSVIFDRVKAADLQKCNLQFRSQYHHAILLYLAMESPPLYLATIGAEELSSYPVNHDDSHVVCEIASRYNLNHNYQINFIKNQEELIKLKKRYPFLDSKFYCELRKYELSYNPSSFYFRRKLKYCYDSLSWRITEPLRAIIKYINGLPIDKNLIPDCEFEAYHQINKVINSRSWRITKILRRHDQSDLLKNEVKQE